jgi:Icc-related predicted phosphoesterase
MKIKIDCVSDLHMYFGPILPGGDVLVVAGDISYVGKSLDFMEFNHWLGEYTDKYKKIVVVPGNHDLGSETNPTFFKSLVPNATHYLLNEPANILGFRFYGSPITPTFMNWAWMADRGEPIKKYWDRIPKNTEVLITHGPAWGIMDECPDLNDSTKLVHVGCEELLKRIKKLTKLKAHIFGHIHECNGVKTIDGVTYVNASIMTGDYQPTQPYHTIHLEK